MTKLLTKKRLDFLEPKSYRADGTPYYWWESSDLDLVAAIAIYFSCLSGEWEVFPDSARKKLKSYLYYWLDCSKWKVLPWQKERSDELIATAYHPKGFVKAIADLLRIGIDPFSRKTGGESK